MKSNAVQLIQSEEGVSLIWLLAVIAPPGCGKSTLLDALAGRLDSNTRQTGEILVNGHKQALACGTSAYVTQDNTLLMTLTVREAVHYSAQLQLPDSMSKSEKKERTDITMKEMGLQDAMDTRIGGWGCKGISCGQKMRVGICVEIITHPRLLFLDEPTSGLDSAASYYVMSSIASLDQKDGIQRTIIVAIHQPSGDVFQLFNNLCLVSSGKAVYFGPAFAANKFFALNGFPCTTLHNPSDHFLKTLNMDFEQDPEQGLTGGITREEATNILIKSYKSSQISQQVDKELSEICKKDCEAMEKQRSHASFLTQCLVLTKRSFVNTYCDVGYYWLRLGIYVVLALILGTIFLDISSDKTTIQARGSLLMFVTSFFTFITIGGFPSFVEEMKVFECERLNRDYGVAAFVISNTLSAVPYLLWISLIPGAITYWLAGLHFGFNHYLYFTYVLFTSMFLVGSSMMIVACIVPNFLMGIIAGSGILGVTMLDSGFYQAPDYLPKPFWRYPLHYLAFHKYAFQGLFKNEFEGSTFIRNEILGPMTIQGEEILRTVWQVEMNYSKWVDLAILLGMVVFCRLLFLVIFKSNEKVKPIFAAFK
ncbi:ABC transporter G family member 11 [Quillaja saponaria]|uniref:ABC transporter G family member 11 n=1 Tax=Quillaja saponaria TaxID=32244 RepID=A0AAD7PUZ6_QUISA|nr:ABC transporter G family member 11 [Quillaja saponaria]